ncbi:MAG: hypothetical protein ACLQVI_04870 [Polyangiaceae bacterium]
MVAVDYAMDAVDYAMDAVDCAVVAVTSIMVDVHERKERLHELRHRVHELRGCDHDPEELATTSQAWRSWRSWSRSSTPRSSFMAAVSVITSTVNEDALPRIDGAVRRFIDLETRFDDLEPRFGAVVSRQPVDDSLDRMPGGAHPVRASSLR